MRRRRRDLLCMHFLPRLNLVALSLLLD